MGRAGSTTGPLPSHPLDPLPSLQAAGPLKYDHLLVALVDAAPTALSDGSKTALAAAAGLASAHGSRVTVLLVDAVAPADGGAARAAAIAAALSDSVPGDRLDFLEKGLDAESTHNAAAAIGDSVDVTAADLLVLSSDAIHSKAVDANLLAEFVDCALLLLP
jgi:hypothetical protein